MMSLIVVTSLIMAVVRVEQSSKHCPSLDQGRHSKGEIQENRGMPLLHDCLLGLEEKKNVLSDCFMFHCQFECQTCSSSR
jgi:hypothetical protein